MQSWTDAQLVLEIRRLRRRRSSDVRAVEELVRRHRGLVVTNCQFLLGEGPDADDIAQEVFLKAYQSVDSLDEPSRFRSWVKRIKINRCLDEIRKRGARTKVDVHDELVQSNEAELHAEPTVVADPRRRALIHSVREALASLDDTYRVPLVMCDVDGLSYKEISEALGIGLSATKMRIQRAREMFRQVYSPMAARGPLAMKAAGGEG